MEEQKHKVLLFHEKKNKKILYISLFFQKLRFATANRLSASGLMLANCLFLFYITYNKFRKIEGSSKQKILEAKILCYSLEFHILRLSNFISIGSHLKLNKYMVVNRQLPIKIILGSNLVS